MQTEHGAQHPIVSLQWSFGSQPAHVVTSGQLSAQVDVGWHVPALHSSLAPQSSGPSQPHDEPRMQSRLLACATQSKQSGPQ